MQWIKTGEGRYKSECGAYTMKRSGDYTIMREVKEGITKWFVLPSTSEDLYTEDEEPQGDVTKLMWTPYQG